MLQKIGTMAAKTMTKNLGGAMERNRINGCAYAATPETHRQNWNVCSVKPVGIGRKSLIPRSPATQTMTSVPFDRTGKPKEKPVMNMNV